MDYDKRKNKRPTNMFNLWIGQQKKNENCFGMILPLKINVKQPFAKQIF